MEGGEGRLDKISTAELQKMFEDNKCLREMHLQNGYFVIDWVRWNVKCSIIDLLAKQIRVRLCVI